MRRLRDGDSTVIYVAESPDFNQDGRWEAVAEIIVDKVARSYEFRCVGAWEGEKVVPPEVYGLDEPAQEEQLRTTFFGFGYGAWTAKIQRWLNEAMSIDEYPAEL